MQVGSANIAALKEGICTDILSLDFLQRWCLLEFGPMDIKAIDLHFYFLFMYDLYNTQRFMPLYKGSVTWGHVCGSLYRKKKLVRKEIANVFKALGRNYFSLKQIAGLCFGLKFWLRLETAKPHLREDKACSLS